MDIISFKQNRETIAINSMGDTELNIDIISLKGRFIANAIITQKQYNHYLKGNEIFISKFNS